jgi:hypothetical protein
MPFAWRSFVHVSSVERSTCRVKCLVVGLMLLGEVADCPTCELGSEPLPPPPSPPSELRMN